MRVHIILNSHLDPVWLWQWPQGVDEVIATTRTACDILDDYPEAIITRGEAWYYETLANNAPMLLDRVKRHIATGRWQAVGGWYIQPDCNLPGPESFRMQADFSRPIFEKLGFDVTVGYNVDSFGHAATLPDFYCEAGMDAYVMMRPQPHEMTLPGNTFIWESPNGNRITTYRISRAYCSTGSIENIAKNIDTTLEEVTPGMNDCMCFIGVGDHGGGPTRKELDWLLEHRNYAEGVELVFSHPRAFFDAVADSGIELPVVKGELQQHSIGCYSVVRQVKTEVRKCETLLTQAENITATYLEQAPADAEDRLMQAWSPLLFNQFHDILAGTSIKSAYEHAFGELGGARSIALKLGSETLRRVNNELPPCEDQRAVFYNSSNLPFRGYVEFEPWLGYEWCGDTLFKIHLVDENEQEIPYQRITPEAAIKLIRLVIPLEIAPLSRRIIRIRHDRDYAPTSKLEGSSEKLDNGVVSVDLSTGGVGQLSFGQTDYLAGNINFAVIADESDTWTHGLKGFGTEVKYEMSKDHDEFLVMEQGSLMGTALNSWSCPAGTVTMEARILAGEPILRLNVRVNWHGLHNLLKLRLRPAFPVKSWTGGCPGGMVEREADARELPMFNFMTVKGDGQSLAVVSRDVFGCDVHPDGEIRLTLLRSPYFAHHEPFVPPAISNYPVCDQGVHDFEIALLPMAAPDQAQIDAEINRQTQPVWFTETTYGCRRELLG